MKKLAIAGASVALAAMPVVGVFAAANPSNWVDTLQVTVEDTCTWTRTLTTEDSTNVTVSNGTSATATAAATMTAAQEIDGFGVSEINVKCNNHSGYKITGTFTTLSGYTSNSKASTITDDIAYGGTSALAEGTWIAKLGDATVGLASGTSGNVANTSAADVMSTGSTYTITYDVYAAGDQAAGYYEGTATYALVQNS